MKRKPAVRSLFSYGKDSTFTEGWSAGVGGGQEKTGDRRHRVPGCGKCERQLRGTAP